MLDGITDKVFELAYYKAFLCPHKIIVSARMVGYDRLNQPPLQDSSPGRLED